MSNERSKAGGRPAAPQGTPHETSRTTLDTDGMLSEWGARLFYPIPRGKSGVDGGKLPLLATAAALAAVMSAHDVRSRIRSTVAPSATQVMVKITGGGRGMKAIAAHFRYIWRASSSVAGKATFSVAGWTGMNVAGFSGSWAGDLRLFVVVV